jgi:hypothetical protein
LLCIGGREAADGEWHKQDEQQFAEHWCDPQGAFQSKRLAKSIHKSAEGLF